MWGVWGTRKKTHMRSFSGVSTAEVSSTSHTWKGSRGSIPVPYGVVNYSSASVASCVILVEEWYVVLMSQSHRLHSSLSREVRNGTCGDSSQQANGKLFMWGAEAWELSVSCRLLSVLKFAFLGQKECQRCWSLHSFTHGLNSQRVGVWNRNSNRSWHPRNKWLN